MTSRTLSSMYGSVTDTSVDAITMALRHSFDKNGDKVFDAKDLAVNGNDTIPAYARDGLTTDEISTVLSDFQRKSDARFAEGSPERTYNNELIYNARKASGEIGTSVITWTAADTAGIIAQTTQNRVYTDRRASYEVRPGETLTDFALRMQTEFSPYLDQLSPSEIETKIREVNGLKPGQSIKGLTLRMIPEAGDAALDMAWDAITDKFGSQVVDAIKSALYATAGVTVVLGVAAFFTGGATLAGIVPAFLAILNSNLMALVGAGALTLGAGVSLYDAGKIIDLLANAAQNTLTPHEIKTQAAEINLGGFAVNAALVVSFAKPTITNAVNKVPQLFKGNVMGNGTNPSTLGQAPTPATGPNGAAIGAAGAEIAYDATHTETAYANVRSIYVRLNASGLRDATPYQKAIYRFFGMAQNGIEGVIEFARSNAARLQNADISGDVNSVAEYNALQAVLEAYGYSLNWIISAAAPAAPIVVAVNEDIVPTHFADDAGRIAGDNPEDLVRVQRLNPNIEGLTLAEQFPATADEIAFAAKQLTVGRRFSQSGPMWEGQINRAIGQYENMSVEELVATLKSWDIPFPHADRQMYCEVLCMLLESKGVSVDALVANGTIPKSLGSVSNWGSVSGMSTYSWPQTTWSGQ